MTKKVIVSAVGTLVVIMIALGGYSLIFKKNKGENALPVADKMEEKEKVTEEKPAEKKMAFSEFIKQGKGAYKCEVKQTLSDMENSGTVYINHGVMRGDFNTIAEGKKIDSSFIMTDGYTYNWSSLAPMGIKIKAPDANTPGDTSASAKGTYSWNAEQIGEYNCEEWTVDENKFFLPAGISFTEIKA